MSVDQETCRAKLANFFAGLSHSKPWWYSIAGSGDWSISNLMRLDPLQSYALLLAAGLIKYKGDSFEVKADEWTDFISSYDLDMQVEKTKTPTKLKAWFVLIGSTASGKQHVAANQFQRLRDVELAGKKKAKGAKKQRKNPLQYDKPRLRLVAESRILAEGISRHIAQEVLELEKRIVRIMNTFNGNEKLSGDLGKISSLFVAADTGEAAGESTRNGSNEAGSEGGEGGEDGILGQEGVQNAVVDQHSAANANSSTLVDPEKYPLLKDLGLGTNLNDHASAVKVANLLRELTRLHQDHADKPMSFSHNNGKVGRLIYVPMAAQASNNFHRSGADRILLGGMLEQMSTKDGDGNVAEDGAVKVLSYFAKNHEEAFITAATNAKLPVANKIDATSAAAIMDDCNLNKTNATILFRHLRDKFGDHVCVALKEIWAVGEGFVKGDFGEFKYAKVAGESPENCAYWTRKMEKILENELSRVLGTLAKAEDVEDIAIAFGGDHGQGAFRALIKIIIRLKESAGDKRKITRIVKTAHIDCKKDNGAIIKGTISTGMKDSVEKVAEGSLELVGGEAKFIDGRGAIAPKLYLSGDLAFYAMVLGKENSDTYHCPYCMLAKPEWQSDNHQKGELWTISKLKQMVVQASTFTKAERPKARGVKENPYWPSIEPEMYIIPILHLSIGLGNYIIAAIFDWINQDIVQISEDEQRVRNSLSATARLLFETREERNAWDASLQGKPELNRIERSIPNLETRANDPNITEEEKDTRMEALNDAKDRAKAMKEHRKDLAKAVDQFGKQETKLKKKLEEHRKARTKLDCSIESLIEDVFKKRRAQRQAYHGGDFNGVDIRRIMADAEKIFDEIGEILVRNAKREKDCTGRQIRDKCKEYGKLTTLLDGAFSMLRLTDASDDDCNKAAQYISKAMTLWRKLGFSVTPKAHILEDHAVKQMRRLGGLGDYLEDFIELSHQSGKRREWQTKGLTNFEQRHASQMQTERRRTDTAVEERVTDVNKPKRKRQAAAVAKETEAKRVKEMRRDKAL